MELFCRTDCICGWIEGISGGENNWLFSLNFFGFMKRICTKTVWASLMLRTATLFTGLCLHLKLKLKNHFICHSTKIYYLLITCRKQRESQNIGSGKSPIIFFGLSKITLLSLIFVIKWGSFQVCCLIPQLTGEYNQCRLSSVFLVSSKHICF